MVPITLLSRRGAPKDGKAPLLQYGYGAYGVPSDPEFSIPALALVDSGWRYAIAHVRGGRSEEHTSALQSLMRISYAVFCLKKKHTTKIQYITLIASDTHLSHHKH